MTKIIISTLLLCSSVAVFSQKENTDIKKGNELYEQGKYVEAEVKYREGLKKNPQSYGATYNLANALYKQERYEDALEYYQVAGSKLKEKDNLEKAAVAHNIGNALLKTDKYAESIQAYKQALRYNPNDEDSRYNLAYAQQMLLQQPPQQQSGQNQDDQNQDQNNQNKNQQQQQQQNDQSMSKENAEQILKAIEEDEKDIQEKIKLKEKKDAKRYNVEKEW